MDKKIKKWGVIALLMILLAAAFSNGTFKQQVLGDTKPVPTNEAAFTRGECRGEYKPLNTFDLNSLQGTSYSKFLHTGTGRIFFIKCDANVEECKATIEFQQAQSELVIGVCPKEAVISDASDIKNKCHDVTDEGMLLATPATYIKSWNHNDKYYSDYERLVIAEFPFSVKGNTVKVEGNVYSLVTISPNNYGTVATGTCNLAALGRDFDMDRNEYNQMVVSDSINANDVVAFGRQYNYITQIRPITDSVNIVKRSNGEWVYVVQPMQVREIKQTKEGAYYVSYDGQPISAPEIICMPLQILPSSNKQCSVDGTKWIEGTKSCTWYGGGLPQGRLRVDNQECLAKCDTSKGEITYYNCVDIIKCPAGSTFNADQNRCVTIGGGTSANRTIGCMEDAQCNDDKFTTSDTCERTLTEKIMSKEGICKNEDISAYIMIVGAIVIGAGVVFFVQNGQKK